MIYEYNAYGITTEAIRLYRENKGMIGEAERAVLQFKGDDPVLSLFDKDGNELRIATGISGGYGGEGPNGTLTILREAGFDVADGFVYRNVAFEISK